MKKFILLLLSLQCILHNNSFAQKPGDLDNSFGIGGKVVTDPGPDEDTIHSIKLQADGKIVVAGNSGTWVSRTIAVGRYNVNGSLDTTFGINGIVTTTSDSAHTSAKAVEIQPDGKIVVAGSFKKGNISDFILARYRTDGSLDSSFGTNGIVTTDLNSGSNDFGNALAIQPDGKIIVAGGSGPYFGLCRYNPDGSLDNTFDSDGKLNTNILGGATCMKQQTNGKIVVAGDMRIARLHPDGSLDNSFGTAVLPIQTFGITIQGDGKILLAGASFEIARIDTAGALDNSFGTGGIGKASFYPSCSGQIRATSIWVQPDGKILAGGWRRCGQLGDSGEFALARFKTNGILDWNSFGISGAVTTQFTSGQLDLSYSSAISPNGKIILAGVEDYFGSIGGFQQWALAQYHLGPMLDVNTIYGTDANVVVAPNPTADLVTIEASEIENGIWRLQICDIIGRLMFSETIKVTNSSIQKKVSLNALPNGIYLLKLENAKSKMMVKVVKNK